MNKVLFVVRGIPGSGKSSLAKMLCPLDDICESDKYFYHNGRYEFDSTQLNQANDWCKAQVEKRMQIGTDRIAVTNTFIHDYELSPYFDLSNKYGYKVISLIVENRHSSENINGLDTQLLDTMRQQFQIKL